MMAWTLKLILLVVTIKSIAPSTNDSFDIFFNPPSHSTFIYQAEVVVQFNLSESLRNYIRKKNDSQFYFGLDNDRDIQNLVVSIKAHQATTIGLSQWFNFTHIYFWQIPTGTNNATAFTTNESNTFSMNVENIGYTKLLLEIAEDKNDSLPAKIVCSKEYHLTARRMGRPVDIGFNSAITFLCIVNAFAIGSLTEVSSLKEQRRYHIALGLSCLTQYIIVPLVVFGLAVALSVQHEFTVGLLYCACVPGGGLGHLIAVVIGNANNELSKAIAFLELVLPLVAVPLWLYTLALLLPNGAGMFYTTIYYMVFWLMALLVPYTLGILVRWIKVAAAEAILNWLIKPLLLLAFILFITLGLYINMYMFTVLDTKAFVVGSMLPFTGFLIGGALIFVARQTKPVAKTVSTHAAVMNCVVVVISIRFTLPQPDADLASAAAMWILFITPAPFVLMLLFHKIKRKILSYFEKREFEKEAQETMLTSFAAITQNALQISTIKANLSSKITADQEYVDENDEKDLLGSQTSKGDDIEMQEQGTSIHVNTMATDMSME